MVLLVGQLADFDHMASLLDSNLLSWSDNHGYILLIQEPGDVVIPLVIWIGELDLVLALASDFS